MKTILLVEDNKTISDLYRERFTHAKFETVTATDGETGLELALKKHPDLIVVDLALPKLNGMELVKQVREDEWGKKLPIIILTNTDATTEKLLQDVVKYQPTYYFVKDKVDPDIVLEKIEELLKK